MREGYDTAQICMNGHVVNEAVETHPEDSKKFCNECGKKTITKCQKCEEPIEGAWVSEDEYMGLRETPAYCPNCGEPYPWTITGDKKGTKPEKRGKDEMTNVELIKSLKDEVNSLPHRNEDALDKLKKRGAMVLRNICPGKPYSTELLNIDFRFRGFFALGDEKPNDEAWSRGKQKVLNLLDTILEEISIFGDTKSELIVGTEISNRIFIVHGHDNEMKAETQTTLVKLGLEPIILHEHPDKGHTIIEKLIEHSNVQFAIILLSPDDLGFEKGDKKDGANKEPRPRARQNVILELGYFIGKLGRERVLAIHREIPNFDFPTDYVGVIYKPYDSGGKWKFEMVQELQAAGYEVDANRLIKKK